MKRATEKNSAIVEVKGGRFRVGVQLTLRVLNSESVNRALPIAKYEYACDCAR